ncbi:MAG TPA: copper chaperone PCu(A)C [Casimicrobiaceae bacterium]
MKSSSSFAALAAIVLGLDMASATMPAAAVITVNQPWLRPAKATQGTEVYMDVTSSEGALLLGAHTDVAGTVTMIAPGKKGVAAGSLALLPGTTVALAPGAYRFALIRVQRPLKLGDRVMLVLAIEMADGSRQDIPVDAEVRMHSPIDDELRAHGHVHSSR